MPAQVVEAPATTAVGGARAIAGDGSGEFEVGGRKSSAARVAKTRHPAKRPIRRITRFGASGGGQHLCDGFFVGEFLAEAGHTRGILGQAAFSNSEAAPVSGQRLVRPAQVPKPVSGDFDGPCLLLKGGDPVGTGGQDDAVPWYQGIELFLSLRRNGEKDGLRRRHNQKDYTVRTQQYFDHYLKGAPAPE